MTHDRLITCTLLAWALLSAPAIAQSGDTAANIRAADIRSREMGTQAGALSVSASDLADYQLALDYLRIGRNASEDGREAFAKKRYDQGLQRAERLYRRNPDWARAGLLVGEFQVVVEDWQGALETYQSVMRLELDPDAPEVAEAEAGVRTAEWHLAKVVKQDDGD